MTKITDDILGAYVDGELPEGKAAELRAEIAASPALQARLQKAENLRKTISHAFDEILNAEPPAHLVETVRTNAKNSGRTNIHNLSTATRVNRMPFWQPIAIAASLAIGIVVGVVIQPQTWPGADNNGAQSILAENVLNAFEAMPSGKQIDGAALSMVSSFKDNSGAYCREFEMQMDALTAGVACKADGRNWNLVALAPRQMSALATPDPSTVYFPASGPTQDTIDTLVNARIDGEKLDATAERNLIASGWLAENE